MDLNRLLHVSAQQLPIAPKNPASQWDTWPFSSGLEESWAFIVTKGLFIIAIFVVIILFVRWLFGPGGRLAEPWMREEWARQRQEELANLEARYARGELDAASYERRKKKLQEPV